MLLNKREKVWIKQGFSAKYYRSIDAQSFAFPQYPVNRIKVKLIAFLGIPPGITSFAVKIASCGRAQNEYKGSGIA